MNSINWSPVRTFTSAMVITTGLLTADSAWADPCTGPVEQTALNTRALQTELMVAALSCGNRIHYNAFVIRYQGDLVKHGRSLQSFFLRKHGAAGRKNLNTFITRLANQASHRSSITHAAFCANSSSLFDRLLSARPVTLEKLLESSTTTSNHDIAPCGGKINTNGKPIGNDFSGSKAIVNNNPKGPK
ncbi:MAG: hypothetical protein ACREU9_13310 [Gammaproteobacteria bacterium]